MVEGLLHLYLLPAVVGVTALARAVKCGTMRIAVAIRAGAERDFFIPDVCLAVAGNRFVASGAGDFLV